MMMCTASRTSSPWHNFVSDTAHWVDSTGTTPCINNGGIYTSASGSAFVAAKANGAKNIFTDTTDATFLGTPSPKFVSGKYKILYTYLCTFKLVMPYIKSVNSFKGKHMRYQREMHFEH